MADGLEALDASPLTTDSNTIRRRSSIKDILNIKWDGEPPISPSGLAAALPPLEPDEVVVASGQLDPEALDFFCEPSRNSYAPPEK